MDFIAIRDGSPYIRFHHSLRATTHSERAQELDPGFRDISWRLEHGGWRILCFGSS